MDRMDKNQANHVDTLFTKFFRFGQNWTELNYIWTKLSFVHIVHSVYVTFIVFR